MSTKAIRQCLEAAGMYAHDTRNEMLASTVAAAWGEVETQDAMIKALADALLGRLP